MHPARHSCQALRQGAMTNTLFRRTGPLVAVCALAHVETLPAQGSPPQQPVPRVDTAVTLTAIKVTAERADEVRVQAMQRLTLPVTASITASQARQIATLADPADAAKYLPS